MNNIVYLTDRISLSDSRLDPRLIKVMRESGLIAPDMVNIHFCGVISYGQNLAVFLPRNTTKDKCNIQSSSLLFKAIHRYYLTKNTGIKAEDSGDSIIGGSKLSLFSDLLLDYQDYGLYISRNKKNTVNNGRVNWSKTIARSTLLPSSNGPVYLDLQTSRSRNDSNSEITRIHATVIRNITQDIGLLWIGATSYIAETLIQTPSSLLNRQTQIAYLEKELRLSYSERDITLIKNIIRYLKETSSDKVHNMVIGTRSFHNMWESLLDECLPNTDKINQKLPIPVYQTQNDEFVPMAQKGQRIDTLLKSEDEQHYAVVDAKYYGALSPNSAPGWSDLVKQFFYVNAVKEVAGSTVKVTNHFIFPGNDPKLKAAYVAHRNKVISDDSDCLSSYPAIHCHYLCPIELLEKYVNREPLNQLAIAVLSY